MSNTTRRAARLAPQVQRVLDLIQTGTETQRELMLATGLGKGTIKSYLQQLFGMGLVQRSGGGYVPAQYGKGYVPRALQEPKPKARPRTAVLPSGIAQASPAALRGARAPVGRPRVELEMDRAEPWIEGWWRQEAPEGAPAEGGGANVAGCDNAPHPSDAPTSNPHCNPAHTAP